MEYFICELRQFICKPGNSYLCIAYPTRIAYAYNAQKVSFLPAVVIEAQSALCMGVYIFRQTFKIHQHKLNFIISVFAKKCTIQIRQKFCIFFGSYWEDQHHRWAKKSEHVLLAVICLGFGKYIL